ncbi:unnamed protein product [Mycena citricolor]|uniref:Uncharacterized protein n=1 Tax=Mycena citricolor TaxID=2018698 RepID=A0AAD2HVS2_9AGAR|nr:unnamed protein product [Mycena citricolor]
MFLYDYQQGTIIGLEDHLSWITCSARSVSLSFERTRSATIIICVGAQAQSGQLATRSKGHCISPVTLALGAAHDVSDQKVHLAAMTPQYTEPMRPARHERSEDRPWQRGKPAIGDDRALPKGFAPAGSSTVARFVLCRRIDQNSVSPVSVRPDGP